MGMVVPGLIILPGVSLLAGTANSSLACPLFLPWLNDADPAD
jgi:hypothetical protein